MVRALDAVAQVYVMRPLCFGRFVRICLHGKQTSQPGDMLFYTTVQYVRISGIPFDSLLEFPCLAQLLKGACSITDEISINQNLHYNRILEKKQDCIELLKDGKFADAIEIIVGEPRNSILRTQNFLSEFCTFFPAPSRVNTPGSDSLNHWFRYFIFKMYEDEQRLTRYEAQLLAKLVILDGNTDLLMRGLRFNLVFFV
jgi:hypothetical protein